MGVVQRAAIRRLGHLAGWSRQRNLLRGLVRRRLAGRRRRKRGLDLREVMESPS